MTERGRLARTNEHGFSSRKMGQELSTHDDGLDTYGNAFFTSRKRGGRKANETKMIVEMLKEGDYMPAPFRVMTKEEKHYQFLR